MDLSDDQIDAVEAAISNRYVAVFGAAGTGKSVVRDAIYEKVPSIILGPTGMSIASTKDGMTVARFLGANSVNIRDAGMLAMDMKISVPNISTRKLIIEEISMVCTSEFLALDVGLRRHLKSSEPFGGLSVVLIGDVYQLQPPGDEYYFFETDLFDSLSSKGLVVTHLMTQHRQVDCDLEDAAIFHAFLSDCRRGYLRTTAAGYLIGLFNNRNPPKDAMRLYSRRLDAEAYNSRKLRLLTEEPEWNYGNLVLKIGARVIFTRNIYCRKTGRLVRPNGAVGTIVGLPPSVSEVSQDSGPISVVDSDGIVIDAVPMESFTHKSLWVYPIGLAWGSYDSQDTRPEF